MDTVVRVAVTGFPMQIRSCWGIVECGMEYMSTRFCLAFLSLTGRVCNMIVKVHDDIIMGRVRRRGRLLFRPNLLPFITGENVQFF